MLNSHKYDVIIIGAGVTGASAAYELANSGISVIVLEKEKLPRYKTCGGGVVRRAIEKLPFNINGIVERNFNMIDVYDHETDLHLEVSRGKPIITMMMRADLDNLIISEAVKKGAKVNDGVKVLNLVNNDDVIEVVTGSFTLKADFVIAADGATGISAKISGMNKNFFSVPAIECEVYIPEDEFEYYKNSTRFDFGFIPHGYAWVFPKRNHLSVGIASMKKLKVNLNDYLKRYFTTLGLKGATNIAKHGNIIPINPFRVKPFFNRILLAGDTIGLADPITTEGISYAIESGQLAAKAIIEGSKNKIKVEKIYAKSLKPLFNELKYARILAWFVHGSPNIRRFVFKHYGKALSDLLADVIMGEKKYSGWMKNPLSYLKLLKP
ncbi:MAG: NAD(P)/FAD-dependent oxidoreductase, partial [Ignavibacteriaceae bacterium]|nr:NAD(P)/FAD-dependent oxidoreductase [Ignavibacteriaceae bacterium]